MGTSAPPQRSRPRSWPPRSAASTSLLALLALAACSGGGNDEIGRQLRPAADQKDSATAPEEPELEPIDAAIEALDAAAEIADSAPPPIDAEVEAAAPAPPDTAPAPMDASGLDAETLDDTGSTDQADVGSDATLEDASDTSDVHAADASTDAADPVPEAAVPDAGACCALRQCPPNRCGSFDNGCNETVWCSCAQNQVCTLDSQNVGSCGACVPFITDCAGHCGRVWNGCAYIDCDDSCGASGLSCGVSGVCCMPQTESTLCAGRCGTFFDPCTGEVQCDGCSGAGELCDSNNTNTCCTPIPTSELCAGKCGSIWEACRGDYVDCGGCDGAGEVCDANVCCLPAPNPCGSAACGTVYDSCNKPVSCGSCEAGQACLGGACQPSQCTPGACGLLPSGEACGTCPSAQHCVDHRCVPECADLGS